MDKKDIFRSVVDRSITEIVIPNGVLSLGYAIFQGCTSLTKVTIPSSVIKTYASIFYGCSALESVRFEHQDGIDVRIGGDFFYSAKTAQAITVFTDNTSIYTTLSSTTYSNITLTILHLDGSSW